MVKTARAQVVHLVLFLGVLLISASAGAFFATGASAGPLEGVTGTVDQTIVEPAREVTETVTPPVHEVTKTVAQPVREGTEALASPVHEAAETVTPPVKETAKTLKPPAKQVTETVASPPVAAVKEAAAAAVHPPTDSTGSSSGNIAKTAGAAVRETLGTATGAAQETVGAAPHAAHPLPSSSGGSQGAASVDGAASTDLLAPQAPERSSAASLKPGDGALPPSRGDDVTAVPPRDGSVRAPLPKWMAYIWPAIALTGPDLAILLGHWEQIGLHLALGASAGSGGGFGVAGVHASNSDRSGRPASSSLLSEIPPAISHALVPDVPASALAYLCLIGLVVIVVFAAVSREIAVGRRHGRGQ